jgi:hypothetical protein
VIELAALINTRMRSFHPLGLRHSLAVSRWTAANLGQFPLPVDLSLIQRDLESLGCRVATAIVSVTATQDELWTQLRDTRPRISWNLTPNTQREFATAAQYWVAVEPDPWVSLRTHSASVAETWQGYGPVLVDGGSWTRATTARKIATRAEAVIYLDHTVDEAVDLLGSRLR